LKEFLEDQNFVAALQEINENSASFPAFKKRFWRWFNMFRIMKFLHYARENGYPDVPIGKASSEFLNFLRPDGIQIPESNSDIKSLLIAFRQLERK